MQHFLRGRIGRTRVAGEVVHLRHAGPLRPVLMASMCQSNSEMIHDRAGSGPIRVRSLSSGPRSVSCVPQNRQRRLHGIGLDVDNLRGRYLNELGAT